MTNFNLMNLTLKSFKDPFIDLRIKKQKLIFLFFLLILEQYKKRYELEVFT